MKGILFVVSCFVFSSLLLISCDTNGAKGTNSNITFSKIHEVINESFEIEDRLDGNLNLDQYKDEIFVIRYNKTGRRSLLICFGANNDEYELYLNSSITLLSREDASAEDPYIEILTKEGKFTIVHSVPNQDSCTIAHEFSYDKNQNQFFLSQISTECAGGDNTGSAASIRTTSDFGKVNLFDFNIQKDY